MQRKSENRVVFFFFYVCAFFSCFFFPLPCPEEDRQCLTSVKMCYSCFQCSGDFIYIESVLALNKQNCYKRKTTDLPIFCVGIFPVNAFNRVESKFGTLARQVTPSILTGSKFFFPLDKTVLL